MWIVCHPCECKPDVTHVRKRNKGPMHERSHADESCLPQQDCVKHEHHSLDASRLLQASYDALQQGFARSARTYILTTVTGPAAVAGVLDKNASQESTHCVAVARITPQCMNHITIIAPPPTHTHTLPSTHLWVEACSCACEASCGAYCHPATADSDGTVRQQLEVQHGAGVCLETGIPTRIHPTTDSDCIQCT